MPPYRLNLEELRVTDVTFQSGVPASFNMGKEALTVWEDDDLPSVGLFRRVYHRSQAHASAIESMRGDPTAHTIVLEELTSRTALGRTYTDPIARPYTVESWRPIWRMPVKQNVEFLPKIPVRYRSGFMGWVARRACGQR